MSTAYHAQTDGQTERTNPVRDGYLLTFVNYDQNKWCKRLLLAEHVYNNSETNGHTMTTVFVNYGFHPQTEWMKESEAHNPWATLCAHWMRIHRQAKQTLENTRESMKKCYDQKATKQHSLEVGEVVMLNVKNIRPKRPLKKLSSKLYGPFKVLERIGSRAYKREISQRWKIDPVFHLSLLKTYRASNRPNREHPPRDPEDIKAHLEWEEERIVKSEIISYPRKVRERNEAMKDLQDFVK